MSGHPGVPLTFWMAGFEGADHLNSAGQALHPNRTTGHWARLEDDYAALAAVGIRCVRESVGWRLMAESGQDGEERLRAHAEVAARHGIQVVWTLMHYGTPAGVSWETADFPDMFAAHCERIARVLHAIPGPEPVYQPINEISFLSWAVSASSLIHPHLPSSPEHGFEVKKMLVRAALRGCDALWSVAPRARILHTDPVVHLVPPPGADEATCQAARFMRECQFQAWDMICGRLEPELGGSPRYLDLLGLNYYHDNQWEFETNARLHWHLGDPRRLPFEDLADEVWRRYGRPMLIAETGHFGEGRVEWLDDIAASAIRCRARGIPLHGLCLYPVIDRPDWEDAQRWHRAGLWDLPGAESGNLSRLACQPMLERLRHWQRSLPG